MNYKPAVLQLITGLGVGGAERVVVELSKAMINNAVDAHVIALNRDCRLKEQYVSFPFQFSNLSLNKNPLSFLKTILRLKKYIEKNKVNIIHAHMFHALVFALIMKMFKPKLKIVFTSHSASGFSGLRKLVITSTKLFRAADVIFSAEQHLSMNAKITRIIKNSVNVSRYSLRDVKIQDKTFLFLGRLEEPKNPIGLIKIFSQLQNKNTKLLVAGDGYLRDDVIEAIRNYELGDRVQLLGVINDVQNVLSVSDCLVLPSLWEGLPMVLLEAGAIGLPVIATPVGAIPELLSDECGYLCELPSFAKKMDHVSLNYDEALLRGKNLYVKVSESYSLGSMVEAHIDVYNTILN